VSRLLFDLIGNVFFLFCLVTFEDLLDFFMVAFVRFG
jgi:hypothetical protein